MAVVRLENPSRTPNPKKTSRGDIAASLIATHPAATAETNATAA